MYLEQRMISLEDSSVQNEETKTTTGRTSPAVERMISLEDSSDQNDINESEESITTRPKSTVDGMNSIEDVSDQNESEIAQSPPPPIDMIPLGFTSEQNESETTTTRRKSPAIDRMNSLEDSSEHIESEITTTRRKPPVVGLVNLGNTCFMNATLQCLARTPNLLDRLMVLLQNPLMTLNGYTLPCNPPAPEVNAVAKNELRLTLDIPQDTMIFKMTELLSKMTSGGNSAVNPVAIHNVVGSEFTPGMQHDSHELLRNIIDRMKRDQVKAIRTALLQSVGVSKKEAASLQKNNPEKANELKELDKKLHQKTIMDEIFGGELVTTRTCLVCNSVKTSREEFLDLSLPIRENRPNNNINHNSNNQARSFYSHDITTFNRSLTECLQRFTEPEILEESNLVDCERCHENKLNLVKSGTPVDQVFPRPTPTQESKNSNMLKKDKGKFQHKRSSNNNNRKPQQLQPPPSPPPLPGQPTTNHVQQVNRRRKKKKTRAEKIADDDAAKLAAAASAIVVTTDSSSGGSNNTILDDSEETNLKDEVQESDSQQDSKELIENDNEIILSENEKMVDDKDKHMESSSSDMDMPDLEKVVPDEGYAEDFKESDDDVDNDNKITKDHHSLYRRRQGHHHVNEDDVDDEEEEDDIGDEDNVIEQKGGEQEEEDGGEKLPKVEPTFEIPKSTKSPSRSQTMIVKPPNNLTIHLKRFTCGLRGVTLKLQDHVTFSEYIDIKEFVTADEICEPDGIRYRLYGIVEHSGSINWGHYVAYVRVNNEWYYISDSYVSPSKLSDVISRSPYMLFYERVF